MNNSPDELFLNGFNSGYSLSNLDPKLAEDVAKSFVSSEDDYVQGFQSGRQEYIREIEQEMTYEDYVKSQSSKISTKDLDNNNLEIEV